MDLFLADWILYLALNRARPSSVGTDLFCSSGFQSGVMRCLRFKIKFRRNDSFKFGFNAPSLQLFMKAIKKG